MEPYDYINEIKGDERAPTNISWWRYVEGENFNTLQLVIRNNDLGTIDIDSESSKKFYQKDY